MTEMVYGRVGEPWWDDKPVAIVAGGKSLEGFDFERLRGATYVLAVKGCIFDPWAVWADAGTGIDAPRYIEWADHFSQVSIPIYWAASGQHDLRPYPHVTFLHRLETEGATDDLGSLTGGGTSGYAAINLALHKRAKKIALFGYDYRGTDGHHNEGHYAKKRRQQEANWKTWAKRFDQLALILKERGVEIVNASLDSQIEAFPKTSLDGAIDWIAQQ